MHGPPLTPRETIDYLQSTIAHLRLRLGIERDEAVRIVAERHGASAQRISALLDRATVDSAGTRE